MSLETHNVVCFLRVQEIRSVRICIILLMIKEDINLGPVLSISRPEDKGLQLNWNFNGIINPETDMYHLVMFVDISLTQAQNFIQTYYSHIKYGDLLGIVEPSTKDKSASKVNWMEKTKGRLQENVLKEKSIIREGFNQEFRLAVKTIKKPRGLVLLNIVCGQSFRSEELQTKIVIELQKLAQQTRKNVNPSDSCVVNFITSLIDQNIIDCYSGSNFFHYFSGREKAVCQELKILWRSIALKSLKVRITLLDNKSFRLRNAEEWKVLDFNSLEKEYFSIPAINFTEYFIFAYAEYRQDISVSMRFELFFTLTQGYAVHDSKEMVLTQNLDKIYRKTVISKKEETNTMMEWGEHMNFLINFQQKMQHIWLSDKKEMPV